MTAKPAVIHVNTHRMRSNKKANHAEKKPPLVTKPGRRGHGSPRYGNTIAILDASGNEVARVVYRPERPLSCSAVAWVEADHGVRIVE